METSQSFRFRRPDRVADIYLATRQNACWRVTLEGNTDLWMFWIVSDDTALKQFWDNRLTD